MGRVLGIESEGVAKGANLVERMYWGKAKGQKGLLRLERRNT